MRKAIIAAMVAVGAVTPAVILILVPILAQGASVQDEIAQTPDPAVTWVAKVAEAIQAETAVTLTADEVQALGRSYAALEQRQAADVALSETHVYVLSPAGTVVLSKALPGK